MEKRQQNLILLVLGSLAAIGPFAVDMYLPGFSAIGRDLKTSPTLVGLTLTSYTLGISIGQLFAGPILDRFGRKKPIMIGLLLFVAAGVGCSFAPSIYVLIILRFFLALGCCVGMVGTNAVVRDLFSGNEIARAMSIMMMVFSLAPITAPVIGGMVVAVVGWRSIFTVLAVIGIVVTIAVKMLLPETQGGDPSISLHPLQVIKGYVRVLKERQFVTYTLMAGTGSASLFSYITSSPFVYVDLFDFSARQFGWIFGGNALTVTLANQVNRVLLKRIGPARVLFLASMAQTAVAIVLFGGAWTGFLGKYPMVVLIACFLFCFGFVLPNATALLLQPFERNAGSASALSGATLMITGTLASGLVSYLHNGTAIPMTLVMGICAALGLVLMTLETAGKRIEG
jgi:DHA1 family bicyclomycin/chloramphenicol resistance-like MFS transporter